MANKDNITRVIIVDESANETEATTALMRKTGLGVRATQIINEEDLLEALTDKTWELIIAKTGVSGLSIGQITNALTNSHKDIPLIILSDDSDESFIVETLRAGAREVVPQNQAARLQLVIKKELDDLEARRKSRMSESSLRESEKRCRSLIDSSRDAISYVHEGMHIYANPIYLEMFGYDDMDEIEGMPIMDLVASSEHATFKEYMRNYGKDESLPNEISVTGVSTGGEEFSANMEFSPASIDGEGCTQIIIRRQTDNKELEEKLKFLSKQDLLTGLYNRQYFMEELNISYSKAVSDSSTHGLLYIMLDNHKAIKDDVGVAAADIVLCDIAKLLQENMEADDILARFEGCIFTAILKNSSEEKAQQIAENLRNLIEHHISDVDDKSVTTTCSIGISLITETIPNAQEALSRSDIACSLAQEAGGNTAHLHHPIADEKASKERSVKWAEKIGWALKNNSFQLAYQPIVSLHGETAAFYEVLLRMIDENKEEIPPGLFIPAIEGTEQIVQVDRWVVGNAINTLSEQNREGKEMTFFIKLSGETLKDKTLLPWISETVKGARLKGDSIVFEVAETTAIEHLKEAKAFSKTVKQLHCRFALEHFGTGANSFQILKHVDADFLKIDGSLIHNLAQNDENQSAIRTMTDTAHSMGKLTIAEFVQDANSLTILWKCGINYIQGYYLQEPTGDLDYDFSGEEAET